MTLLMNTRYALCLLNYLLNYLLIHHQNYVFLYLNRETRENLLHYAINDDFVECTTLVCIHAKDCQATNHRNIYGDNCYHLAARQLKIKHLVTRSIIILLFFH